VPDDARPPRRRSPIALVPALLLGLALACLTAGPAMAMPAGVVRAPLSLTILKHPNPAVHTTTASFGWRQSGAARTRCRIDSKTWKACTTSAKYTGLAEGKHAFSVKVSSRSGHSITKSFKWRVDLTAPTAPIAVTGGSLTWTSGSRTMAASGATDGGSGLLGYQYRLSADAGSTWAAISTGSPATITSGGDRIAQFRAIDRAGNVSGWVPAVADAASTVRIDRTDPTAPAVTGGSTAWQNVAQIDLTASGSVDAGGSGFDRYDVQTSTDGGATWTPAAPGSLVSRTAEGETLARFSAVDVAGNRSSWVTAHARIDRTAPSDPNVIGGTASWQSMASATVTASGSTDVVSGLDHYERSTSLDGGANWSAWVTGGSLTVTAEGETLVRFRAVDEAGFTSAAVQDTVQLDRTAPSLPTVSGTAAGWQNVASVDATASGSTDPYAGLAGYQYATSDDGSIWSAPIAGAALTVSDQGEQFVRFRAVDALGHASAWVSGPVRIDRSSPTNPTVSGGMTTWTKAASATVTASGSADSPGSGIDHYERATSTDGGATWGPTSVGSSQTVTAQNETLVRFRSVDASGLASGWVQVSVLLDRTAPGAPTVSGGSTAWQSVASVIISGGGSTDSGGSALSGYQHRTSTDGGSTWSSAVAGPSVTVTAPGRTIVQVRAIDAAGNVSAWVADEARLDTTAPTAPSVTGGASGWQSVASLVISGAGSTDTGGSALAGYQRRLSTDGGASWSAPVSGAAETVTAEGETLVQVRSLDGAGNTSAWAPASITAGSTARIDRSTPTVPTVTGGSSSWQTAGSVTVGAAGSADSGSGLAGYEYRTSTNGGSAWSAAATGASVAVTAEGSTVVQFRSVDVSGAKSAWAPSSPVAASSVKLDRSAPSLPTVSGGGATWQNVASITVTAAGSTDLLSGMAGFSYRTSTDGGSTWSAAAAGATVTVSAEGSTMVQFRSADNVGNTTAWVSATARIDRTAPSVPIVSGGSSSWQSVSPVAVTAAGSSDSGSGLAGYQYQTSTDGGSTWSAAAGGASASINAEGITLVQFRSVDNAGFTSAWTSSATVKLDTMAPTAPLLTGGGSAWSNASSVTVTAAGSTDGGSGVAGYRYQTSSNLGVTWSGSTTGTSVTISAQADTWVRFQSWDGTGSSSPWTTTQVRLDRTLPTTPVVAGGSLSWLTLGSTILTAGGSIDTGGSGLARYEYRSAVNGGAWSATVSAGTTATIAAEATTVVQFRAVDGAGNVSAWAPAANGAANTVKLDRTAPTLPAVSGGSTVCVKKRTISASGSVDAVSGVARYEYRSSSNNGSTWSAAVVGSSVQFTVVGKYIVQFRTVDNAGNTTAWAPATSGSGNTACIK
jgi:hypothetical protein